MCIKSAGAMAAPGVDLRMRRFQCLGVQGALGYVVGFQNEEQAVNACFHRLNRFPVVICTNRSMTAF